MATTLDLDEYLGEYMTITHGEHVIYALRQDVPARVLIAAFTLTNISKRLEGVSKDLTPEEQMAAAEVVVEQFLADVQKVCLRIVQHTYPNETAEEMNKKLSENDQQRIVNAFFIRRSPVSSQQPTATDETSSDSAPTTTASQPLSRAQKRKLAHSR